MRYSELNITTQRQAPARVRSQGEALLRRAGYRLGDGTLTALGERSYARLEELAERSPAAEFFAALRLPVIGTQGGEHYYTMQAGKVEVLHCKACGYAARRAVAAFRKSQPAPEQPAPMEQVATPERNTIEALAHYLGLTKEKTAKALMYTRTRDNRFVFVVIRGDMQLSEAKLQEHIVF